MARTPPSGPSSAPPAIAESAFNFGPDAGADTPKRGRDASSPGNAAEAAAKKSKTQRSLVAVSEELGSLIDELINAFKPRAARHITQANRDLFSRMKGLNTEITCRLAENEPASADIPVSSKSELRSNGQDMSTQTSPPKTKLTGASSQFKQSGSVSKPAEKQRPLLSSVVADGSKTESTSNPLQRTPQSKAASWAKVHGRQQPHKRVRADAITVSGHLSGDVQAVRKTAKGDILLRLSKKPAHSPEELQEAVGKALGSRAVVKKLTEMSQVEIRDLDELVTKEEVLEAVKGAINDTALTIDIIKSLRAMRDGSQIASLLLPASKAKILVELAKIRIGWAVCRVKHILQPKRCFSLSHWKVSDVYTASDHAAILCTLQNRTGARLSPSPQTKAYRIDTFNTLAFTTAIQPLAITGNAESMAAQVTAQLTEACDCSMARRKAYGRHHVPAYWWNERIASARQACLHARRRYTRSRGRQNFWELQMEYKSARRMLKSEIRRSKRECFLELCDSAEYDPWGKAYKTIVKRVNAGNQTAPTDPCELKRIVETLFQQSE
ncbi:hypothetical protein ACLKA7_001810 [Drosophila subpalustris]